MASLSNGDDQEYDDGEASRVVTMTGRMVTMMGRVVTMMGEDGDDANGSP